MASENFFAWSSRHGGTLVAGSHWTRDRSSPECMRPDILWRAGNMDRAGVTVDALFVRIPYAYAMILSSEASKTARCITMR